MPTCENCHGRAGKLVLQYAHGPCGRYGEVPRFVYRLYLCPYCLAAHNRRAKKEGHLPLEYIEHKIDDEILVEVVE